MMPSVDVFGNFFAKIVSVPLRYFLACCLLAGLPVSLSASYLEHEDARLFMQEMVSKHQYDAQALQHYLGAAQSQESILKAIARPAEKRLEWHEYRRLFINASRVEKGIEFVGKYDSELRRAEATYGVDRHVIAAIIGVETSYGKNKGSYRVIDALATLAFDYPPRREFFRSELEHYLLMVREQKFDGLEVKGSYAGAMGYGQFMPSSYRHYAVDFTSDGVADLLNNPVDAIGSVANYLRQHRWEPGGAVVERAQIGDVAAVTPFIYTDLKPANTLAELRKHSVQLADSALAGKIKDDDKAKLLRLEGDAGTEYWIALSNFYVITRYNHSSLYAMAVWQLATELANATRSSANAAPQAGGPAQKTP